MARAPHDDGSEPRPVALQLPYRTIVRALLGLLAAVAAIKLWPLCLQVVLALLVAVSLYPVVVWLRQRGMPHGLAVTLVAFAIVVLLAAFMLLAVPPLIGQVQALLQSVPQLRDDTMARMPPDGVLHDLLEKVLSKDNLPEPGQMLKNALTLGGVAMGALAELGIVLTIAVYLLFDGDSTWRWLLPYLPPRHRDQLHQTAGEVAEVVFAYVAGQVITSALCAIFTFAVLLLLKVPAALVLALIAGVFDILPIIGFFLSIIPAVALALTVSPTTALLVAGAYIAYNALENYVIVPKIYGSRMRLSTLTVLLALFAGGLLAGIVGAIVVLPIVASYPIIERIWLARWLGREVVQKHAEEIERDVQERERKRDPEQRDPEDPQTRKQDTD
jgi:predicted PurR-regulated permease PerM